ncbi:alpha/beta hydrolase [Rufibacter tibetensis]|nr:alpha/beta fold hydrolase [Rufibacter tibetensis]
MIVSILKATVLLYAGVCALLYFIQESLIFFPEKLGKNFRFTFDQPFEEIGVETKDNVLLSAVLFKAANPKGVVFYLHGNAGSIHSWSDVAPIYTALEYDVFMLDYRGYGKSEGKIRGEKQFYQDMQAAYDLLKTRYNENDIVVLGYSIGSGPAAKIASTNKPRLLILQAPYYNLKDLMRHYFPVIPTFVLKYPFETNKFIQQCTMPVVIFHGEEDEIIYYGSSLKLKKLMKPEDTLITLKGQTHNGMSSNPAYLTELKRILQR